MPRFRTTVWEEQTVTHLFEVEIEAPSLEAAIEWTNNPTRPEITEWGDSIDSYYPDEINDELYPDSHPEVTPIEQPPVKTVVTRLLKRRKDA